MYQRILVPLDGSELAEKALPYTTIIAKLRKSEVTLFAVSITKAGGRRDRLLKSYLDFKAKELESQGIRASTAIEYGDTAEEIIQYTSKNNINLTIISTHGYSGIKRWILGSVTQKVLYGTCTPILLIKSKSPDLSNMEFKKVLVPLDESSFSEATLPFVEELLKGAETEISLVKVNELPIVPSYGSHPINPTRTEFRDTLWHEMELQSTSYLEKIKDDLVRKGLKANFQIEKGQTGETAQHIIKVANEKNVDLIIISTHGRTGISRWIYGSTTTRIIEESTQPILLIRPSIPR
jgi:nucleotide-binding universal stress UspA family protein